MSYLGESFKKRTGIIHFPAVASVDLTMCFTDWSRRKTHLLPKMEKKIGPMSHTLLGFHVLSNERRSADAWTPG